MTDHEIKMSALSGSSPSAPSSRRPDHMLFFEGSHRAEEPATAEGPAAGGLGSASLPVSRFMDPRAYAMFLGLNLRHSKKDQTLFTVLRPLFLAPLPSPWSARNDPARDRIYFWNAALAESSYRHPLEGFFVHLIGVLKDNLFMKDKQALHDALLNELKSCGVLLDESNIGHQANKPKDTPPGNCEYGRWERKKRGDGLQDVSGHYFVEICADVRLLRTRSDNVTETIAGDIRHRFDFLKKVWTMCLSPTAMPFPFSDEELDTQSKERARMHVDDGMNSTLRLPPLVKGGSFADHEGDLPSPSALGQTAHMTSLGLDSSPRRAELEQHSSEAVLTAFHAGSRALASTYAGAVSGVVGTDVVQLHGLLTAHSGVATGKFSPATEAMVTPTDMDAGFLTTTRAVDEAVSSYVADVPEPRLSEILVCKLPTSEEELKLPSTSSSPSKVDKSALSGENVASLYAMPQSLTGATLRALGSPLAGKANKRGAWLGNDADYDEWRKKQRSDYFESRRKKINESGDAESISRSNLLTGAGPLGTAASSSSPAKRLEKAFLTSKSDTAEQPSTSSSSQSQSSRTSSSSSALFPWTEVKAQLDSRISDNKAELRSAREGAGKLLSSRRAARWKAAAATRQNKAQEDQHAFLVREAKARARRERLRHLQEYSLNYRVEFQDGRGQLYTHKETNELDVNVVDDTILAKLLQDEVAKVEVPPVGSVQVEESTWEKRMPALLESIEISAMEAGSETERPEQQLQQNVGADTAESSAGGHGGEVVRSRYVARPVWHMPAEVGEEPRKETSEIAAHVENTAVKEYQEKLDSIKQAWEASLRGEYVAPEDVAARDADAANKNVTTTDVVDEESGETYVLVADNNNADTMPLGAEADALHDRLMRDGPAASEHQLLQPSDLSLPDRKRDNRSEIAALGMFGTSPASDDRCFGNDSVVMYTVPLKGCCARAPSPRPKKEIEAEELLAASLDLNHAEAWARSIGGVVPNVTRSPEGGLVVQNVPLAMIGASTRDIMAQSTTGTERKNPRGGSSSGTFGEHHKNRLHFPIGSPPNGRLGSPGGENGGGGPGSTKSMSSSRGFSFSHENVERQMVHDTHRDYLPEYVTTILKDMASDDAADEASRLRGIVRVGQKQEKPRPLSADGRLQAKGNATYYYNKHEGPMLKANLQSLIQVKQCKNTGALCDPEDSGYRGNLQSVKFWMHNALDAHRRAERKAQGLSSNSEDESGTDDKSKARNIKVDKNDEEFLMRYADPMTGETAVHRHVYGRLFHMLSLMPQDLAEVAYLPSVNHGSLVPTIGITDEQAQSFVRAVHRVDRAGMLQRPKNVVKPSQAQMEEESNTFPLLGREAEYCPDADCEGAVMTMPDDHKLYVKNVTNQAWAAQFFHGGFGTVPSASSATKEKEGGGGEQTQTPTSSRSAAGEGAATGEDAHSASSTKSPSRGGEDQELQQGGGSSSTGGGGQDASKASKKMRRRSSGSSGDLSMRGPGGGGTSTSGEDEQASLAKWSPFYQQKKRNEHNNFKLREIRLVPGFQDGMGLPGRNTEGLSFAKPMQSARGNLYRTSPIVQEALDSNEFLPLSRWVKAVSEAGLDERGRKANAGGSARFLLASLKQACGSLTNAFFCLSQAPIGSKEAPIGGMIISRTRFQLNWGALMKERMSIDPDVAFEKIAADASCITPMDLCGKKSGAELMYFLNIRLRWALQKPCMHYSLSRYKQKVDKEAKARRNGISIPSAAASSGSKRKEEFHMIKIDTKLQGFAGNEQQNENSPDQEGNNSNAGDTQSEASEVAKESADALQTPRHELPEADQLLETYIMDEQEDEDLQWLYKRSREVERLNRSEFIEKIGSDFEIACAWNTSHQIDRAISEEMNSIVTEALTLFANSALAELNRPRKPLYSVPQYRSAVNAKLRETRDKLAERRAEVLSDEGDDMAKLRDRLKDVNAELLDDEMVAALMDETEQLYERVMVKRGKKVKKPMHVEFADDPFFHVLPPVMRAIADTTLYRTYSQVFREIGGRPKDFKERQREMQHRKKLYERSITMSAAGGASQPSGSSRKRGAEGKLDGGNSIDGGASRLSNSRGSKKTDASDAEQTEGTDGAGSVRGTAAVDHNRQPGGPMYQPPKAARSTYSMWNAGVDLKRNNNRTRPQNGSQLSATFSQYSSSITGGPSTRENDVFNSSGEFSFRPGDSKDRSTMSVVPQNGHNRSTSLSPTKHGRSHQHNMSQEVSAHMMSVDSLKSHESFLEETPSWFQSQEAAFQNQLKKLQSKKVKNTLLAVSEQHRQEKEYLNKNILGLKDGKPIYVSNKATGTEKSYERFGVSFRGARSSPPRGRGRGGGDEE